jgi:Carboxypeptidase regulatory-like domain
MRKLFSFIVLSFLVGLTALGQNNQTMHLKGKVLDPTSLPMAASSVKVYKGNGAPKQGTAAFKEGQTDNAGDFDIELPAGDYYVDISAPDFNEFRQAVKATANMQPLAVTLTVKNFETVVEVTNTQSEVGVDPDSSLTTDTITGDALLDLPDNEEDLLAYLQELAAARGIVDGELNIRVDGFENSYLPNRAEIQEIRIVNTSFSADGNSSGPRIEIVTRPGTGFWTGNLGFNFGDESLNAASPLTNRKPASQTRNFDGQLRGPIIPGKVTATISVQNQEQDSEGNAIRAVWINGPVDQGISTLRRTRTFRFGPNLTINKVHSVVANFNYSDTRSDNSGIGGFNLPQRASDQRGHNWTLQLTERANFSARLSNEFRVQARQNNTNTLPVFSAVAINVQDAFNGGGATNKSVGRTQDFLVGNTLRWQVSRKLTLTMAGEANFHKSHNDTESNYLGTYTFASLNDYCYAEALANGGIYVGSECLNTQAIIDATPPGEVPTFMNSRGTVIPITGVATQFRITTGNPVIDVNQAEYDAYIQGEWRVAPRAQVSFGARYQAQQHLNDYNNLAPTAGISYQLSTKQNWQTVVRAGGRMNYQTYSMGSWEQLLRNGAAYQTDYLVLNPTYPLPDLSGVSGLAPATATTTRIRASDYVAGYSFQPTLSVDQSLPKGNRISLNFQINRGLHQTRNRNINAPFPGTPLPSDVLALLNFTSFDKALQDATRAEGRAMVNALRPDPLAGNISQSESSGSSFTKNFSIQYRINNKRILWNKVQIGGTVSWNMNWAEDNSGNPVNNYDLAAEWGRSSQDQRHRITGSLNIQTPWNLRFSFSQMGYNSGRPYTLTTGYDLNGDGSNNDRPEGIGRNTETGPSYINPISLTVTKTIPFGARRTTPRPSNDYVEPQRGGGGFGGGGGGFGGGGNNGGFGGNNGGGNRNGGRQVQLSVRVSNLFNSTIRSGISGVMTSPLFGQSTGGGQGRRITLSLQTNLGQLF